MTHGIPAVQVALLYRCWAQGPGGLKTGTLMNDELAMEEGWDEPRPDDARLDEFLEQKRGTSDG